MAQIGCLGDIIFTVSSDKIETPNNIQWSGSVRYSIHERHLTHALTEYTGIDPDTISFDLFLSSYLGVHPMEELIKLWAYERDGTPLIFVVGDKLYGKYRWTIKNHEIKMKTYDKYGSITGASVSVSLLEYINF